MTTKPEPIKYETSYGYTVTLDDPNQLVIEQGYTCINGGKIKHNGKMVKLMVRYDNKPELAAKIKDWEAAWEQYETDKAAEFDRNVPGLDELRAAQDAAYNEQARYDAEFSRMMDTGHGISPKSVDTSLAEIASELAAEYPRAAMYLQAKDYTYANNHHKYGAGKDAMDLIAQGGSLEDAAEILENWLPESTMRN